MSNLQQVDNLSVEPCEVVVSASIPPLTDIFPRLTSCHGIESVSAAQTIVSLSYLAAAAIRFGGW
jgi:hypothetical protein